jgi:Ca2+-binding RTX toxin-like protein
MRRTLLLLSTMMLALLLASGVAWAVNMVGTNGPDTLRGTNGDDNLIGNGGNDRLFARNGRDNLLGGPGKDCLLCATETFHFFAGDKNLFGGPGNDFVWAGKGADKAEGGEGNDLLPDDSGRELSQDNFSGGPGNDVIDVPQYRSARGDRVVCGSGFDRVAADKEDVVAPDCERVDVFRGGTPSDFEDFFNSFYDSVPDKWFDGLQKRCLPGSSDKQALVRAKKG